MSFSSSTCLERWALMSMPVSAIARTARGFIPCGSTPAEYASITSPLSARAKPSAIWLRQLLPVQRNRILSLAILLSYFGQQGQGGQSGQQSSPQSQARITSENCVIIHLFQNSIEVELWFKVKGVCRNFSSARARTSGRQGG